MKLVFINTIALWGGGEKWTVDTAVEMCRRRHDVSLVAAERGAIVDEAARFGILCEAVPNTWLRRFGTLKRLRRTLGENPPDLIVANCGKDVRLAHRLGGAAGKAPLIFRRGLDRPISDHPFHRHDFRAVDAIIANSLATKETIRASFPWYGEDRITVIYNPVHIEAFERYRARDVRRELGIGKERFVIAVVGRLSRQKGHRYLFEAVTRLVSSGVSLSLLVVGDGELRGSLEKMAEKADISGITTFTGHVREVQPYYEAADIIIVPSLYEGFCFAALEAQLMGKPVIASRTSSLPEIVTDGRTGILVPAKDPGRLAETILELYQDPERRAAMGSAGRSMASERFGAERIYDELERLFEFWGNRSQTER